MSDGDRILERDRKRRYRRRKELGIRVLPVEVGDAELKRLIELGLIDDDDLRDHESTAEALGSALAELIAGEGERKKVPFFPREWRTQHMAPKMHREPPEKRYGPLWRPPKK